MMFLPVRLPASDPRARGGSLRLAAVILCLGVCAAARLPAATPEAADPFTRGEAMVHPHALHKFDCWISDRRANVAAIVLDASFNTSNEYYSAIEQHEGWRSADLADGGYYSYRYLGALDNGLLVVHTVESGGGSGRFHGLKVLERERLRLVEEGEIITTDILVLRGSLTLGDRYAGELRLAGDAVLSTGADEGDVVRHCFAGLVGAPAPAP